MIKRFGFRFLGILFLLAPLFCQAQFRCVTNAGTIAITRYTGPGGDVAIPPAIDGLPVSRIGRLAFWNCTNVTRVALPSSVSIIEYRAFENCTGLAEISFSEGLSTIDFDAFNGCSSLLAVTLPASVAVLDSWMFWGCTNLVSIQVALENPIFSSEDGVLFSKTKDMLIRCPEGKAGNYTIPDSVWVIRGYAFKDCTRLTAISLPEENLYSHTEIDAFRGCTGLTNMVIPARFEGDLNSFSACTGLTHFSVDPSNLVFTIQDGVIYRGNELMQYPAGRKGPYSVPEGIGCIKLLAFAGSDGLTEVNIPASVAWIENAFPGCASLASINVDSGNTIFSSDDGVLFTKDRTRLILYPEGKPGSYAIPPDVTVIGEGAFAHSRYLEEIMIPEGVESIESSAFIGCANLMTVTIPATVTNIANYAFTDCPHLTAIRVNESNLTYSSVGGVLFNKARTLLIQHPNGRIGPYVIPSSVTGLCNMAFYTSAKITSLTFPDGITSLQYLMYSRCANLTAFYFRGDAPDLDLTELFTPNKATVYRMEGTTGWRDMFGGHPVELLDSNGITAPVTLPPLRIGQNKFTARWIWVEGEAPEGEFSVASDPLFAERVTGFEERYIVNRSECLVTNLVAGRDYWYRVRRLTSIGFLSPWSSPMKVRTGESIPSFRNLIAGGPVSKGVTQSFAMDKLTAGTGILKVKSSDCDAVEPSLGGNRLSLHYRWKTTNSAAVRLTLVHGPTGYKVVQNIKLWQPQDSLAVVGQSALTNAGTGVVAQEITLENRTGETVHGVRIQVKGLDTPAWLNNRTGFDPAGTDPIREIPCVLPVGSQTVMRLIYQVDYRKQAKRRPATYRLSVVLPPMNEAADIPIEQGITQKERVDGLWLLGMPANPNRLYRVYHSDDYGVSWLLGESLRATARYLMWRDIDEEAPEGRVFRVIDSGKSGL